MKKLFALAISLVMALVMLVPAYAADDEVGPDDLQTPPESLSMSDSDQSNHGSTPRPIPTPALNPPKTNPVVETVPNLYLDSTQYLLNADDGLCVTTLEAGKAYIVENEFWLISKDGKGSLTDACVRMNDTMREGDGVDYIHGPIYDPLILVFSDEAQIKMSGGISAILRSGQTAKFHYVKDSAELVVTNCPPIPLADDELFSDSGAKIGNTGANGKLAANESCMIRFRIMVESVSEPIAPPVNTPATESDPYAQPNKEPEATMAPLIDDMQGNQQSDSDYIHSEEYFAKSRQELVDARLNDLSRYLSWCWQAIAGLAVVCVLFGIALFNVSRKTKRLEDYIADMERDTFEPATQDDESVKHPQRRYGDFFKHGSGDDDDGSDTP